MLIALTVSEPIGLELVRLNGGSYTAAILFCGFMYIGAAVFLWLVRAWKIGEMEKEAAVLHTDVGHVDPVAVLSQDEQRVAVAKAPVTSFMKRMLVWTKV